MSKEKKIKTDQIQWPPKAYNNYNFLNSPAGRTIRVLCEFEEPASRFRKLQLRNTIVFFGSARALSKEKAGNDLEDIKRRIKAVKNPSQKLLSEKEHAERMLLMSKYYEDAALLSEKLTKWFMRIQDKKKRFYICSGGGPGIMEAANLGAMKAGGQSVGLNISLPMEQMHNPYQTKEMSFDFHYFFIRKFWFFYLSKAMVVFPGGFGTMDEFFELLTLVQTRKTKKFMPIVLYGPDYWNDMINFDELVKWGTIDSQDLKLFQVYGSVEEAFDYLKTSLTKAYL